MYIPINIPFILQNSKVGIYQKLWKKSIQYDENCYIKFTDAIQKMKSEKHIVIIEKVIYVLIN